MNSIMRALGDDMAAIFSGKEHREHPARASLEYRSNPSDDTQGDGMAECEMCGEMMTESDRDECEVCIEDGQARYRREHDSGAER